MWTSRIHWWIIRNSCPGHHHWNGHWASLNHLVSIWNEMFLHNSQLSNCIRIHLDLFSRVFSSTSRWNRESICSWRVSDFLFFWLSVQGSIITNLRRDIFHRSLCVTTVDYHHIICSDCVSCQEKWDTIRGVGEQEIWRSKCSCQEKGWDPTRQMCSLSRRTMDIGMDTLCHRLLPRTRDGWINDHSSHVHVPCPLRQVCFLHRPLCVWIQPSKVSERDPNSTHQTLLPWLQKIRSRSKWKNVSMCYILNDFTFQTIW